MFAHWALYVAIMDLPFKAAVVWIAIDAMTRP
jgi:hypothetical protein